jgi:hypothetical protein
MECVSRLISDWWLALDLEDERAFEDIGKLLSGVIVFAANKPGASFDSEHDGFFSFDPHQMGSNQVRSRWACVLCVEDLVAELA